MTALIGYARVSEADGSQVIDLQRDALAKTGVDLEHHLYNDVASGKRDDWPGLDACIKALRHGDTLVVWKLDRLGRDQRHLVNLVGDLTKRDIGLRYSPARAHRSTLPPPTAASASRSSPGWLNSSAS